MSRVYPIAPSPRHIWIEGEWVGRGRNYALAGWILGIAPPWTSLFEGILDRYPSRIRMGARQLAKGQVLTNSMLSL